MENSKLPYKSLVVLFVALVAGVLASLIVKQAFVKPKATVDPVVQGRLAPVLVAKNAIATGDEITALNIRFDRIPEDEVPRDAITSFSDAVHRKAINNVADGSILSLYDLDVHEENSDREPGFIPPGYRVVPVSIETITSGVAYGDMSGFLPLEDILAPGDQVSLSVVTEDVEASSTANAGRKLVTRPLLNEIGVYKVASEMRPNLKDGRPSRSSVISLLLSQADANKVERSVGEGRLRLSVLNPASGSKAETQLGLLDAATSPVTANLLNGLGGFQEREKEDSVQVASQPYELPIANNDHFITGFGPKVSPKTEPGLVPPQQLEEEAAVPEIQPMPQRPAVELVVPGEQVKQANWNMAKDVPAQNDSSEGKSEKSGNIAPPNNEASNTPDDESGGTSVPASINPSQDKAVYPELNKGFRPRPVESFAAPDVAPSESNTSHLGLSTVPPVAVPRSVKSKPVLSSTTAYSGK
ncbi:MAG: Flp pilus assembly protein CpaB [Planctomycetia bacterium]|nr:Flp pilus assembly protein CpaB [Planctomycetia bacterium]